MYVAKRKKVQEVEKEKRVKEYRADIKIESENSWQ